MKAVTGVVADPGNADYPGPEPGAQSLPALGQRLVVDPQHRRDLDLGHLFEATVDDEAAVGARRAHRAQAIVGTTNGAR